MNAGHRCIRPVAKPSVDDPLWNSGIHADRLERMAERMDRKSFLPPRRKLQSTEDFQEVLIEMFGADVVVAVRVLAARRRREEPPTFPLGHDHQERPKPRMNRHFPSVPGLRLGTVARDDMNRQVVEIDVLRSRDSGAQYNLCCTPVTTRRQKGKAYIGPTRERSAASPLMFGFVRGFVTLSTRFDLASACKRGDAAFARPCRVFAASVRVRGRTARSRRRSSPGW